VVIHFSVGDRVIIRFGKQQGQKATILKAKPGDEYTVRIEDGSVLNFSGKGLEPAEGSPHDGCDAREQP
jgi:hypothetical protein